MKNHISIQTKKENVVLKIEEEAELRQIIIELKKYNLPENWLENVKTFWISKKKKCCRKNRRRR